MKNLMTYTFCYPFVLAKHSCLLLKDDDIHYHSKNFFSEWIYNILPLANMY